MDKLFTWPFLILHISIVLTIVMIVITLRRNKKTQLHYIFVLDMIALLIWSLGQLLLTYYMYYNNLQVSYLLVTFYFIGVCFLPPFLLFTGLIYYKGNIKITFLKALIFIPSFVSLFLAATIEQNQLLIVKYSHISSEMITGSYFYIHNAITYLYIVIGLGYLIFTSLKTSGFFSKQSLMIILGVVIPFSTNILSSYGLINDMPVYITPVVFTFGIMLFIFSILKYDFLNVMPVALTHIFNQLSDGVIIVDESKKILDFNKSIMQLCSEISISIERNKDIIKLIKQSQVIDDNSEKFSSALTEVIKSNIPYTFEKTIETKSSITHLNFVISNVIVNNKYYCTTILIKDVTEITNKMHEIERNQEVLMEQERLASLGNLIAGIAHNLKTPIMTISGVFDTLSSLGKEYLDSINDPLVSKEDHTEIANEIIEWTNKVPPHCAYMSEMISAVKGQATQLATASERIFTLRELLNRIRLLMKFELKKHHCQLTESISASQYSRIKGDISSLVQVFNNIITNAIQSYSGRSGSIIFDIDLVDGYLLFSIKDSGYGMDDIIKASLFKEMITTKGKAGTGLGLYMSYSTIIGHFKGELSFDSNKDIGTTFYVKIPAYKENKNET